MQHHDATSIEARGRKLRVMLIALIFFATALNYVDRQVLALLKPTLEAEFNWSDRDFAHMGSAFQLAAAGALIFVGWFVDRFGVRFAYGLAVVVWSMAGMAHALASTVQQFVVARMVLAAAEAVNTPAAMKAAAVYLPLRERSVGIGVINTAPNIGAIVTPLLIPPFAVAFGWQAAFLVTGALGFVWIIFWIAGTKSLARTTSVRSSSAEQASAEPMAPVAEGNKVQWREIIRDRRSWAVIGAKALTDLVWWFVLFWMPDYFSRVFGLSQAEIGVPTAIVFTLAALGAISSGGLFPVLLSRGLSLDRARKSSMLFFALVVLFLPVAMWANSPWVAAVLIGLGLFAHQGFSTNLFGMATDIVPQRQVATVIAMGAIAGNLTGALMLEFAGWALTSGLGYAPMFMICGSAYLLALAWIHLMQPRLALADGTE